MRELKWTMSQKYDSSSTKHFRINHNFGLFSRYICIHFKTKRPSDYFALFLFLALWRASLFLHFCIWSWVAPLATFFFFFKLM